MAKACLSSALGRLTLTNLSAAVPSSSRSFSTTNAVLASARVVKARTRKRNNVRLRAQRKQEKYARIPHPVFGYPAGQDEVWESSKLRQVLLDRKKVWDGTAEGGSQSDKPTLKDFSKPAPPNFLNFGLTPDDAHYLSTLLPATEADLSKSAARASKESSSSEDSLQTARDVTSKAGFKEAAKPRNDEVVDEEAITEEENAKRARLLRIVDLRNASSRDISKANNRRIAEAFGRKIEGDESSAGADTGSPAVQAAMLTFRIHTLVEHLRQTPRDLVTKRVLTGCVQRRAKMLRYLRRRDPMKWKATIAECGIVGGSPSGIGEIVIKKGEETRQRR